MRLIAPPLRLARLDPWYVRRLQETVRDTSIDIRGMALQSIADGSSFAPIHGAQRAFLFRMVRQIFDDLTAPCAEMVGENMLWVVSGSYARGTCIPGSDLDIDAFYPDRLAALFSRVEEKLCSALTIIIGLRRKQVHPHLKHATMHALHPMEKDVDVPYACNRRLLIFTNYLLSFTGKSGKLDFFIYRTSQQLIESFASRDWVHFEKVALMASAGRLIFPFGFDFAFNTALAAGNQSRYLSFEEQRKIACACLKTNMGNLQVGRKLKEDQLIRTRGQLDADVTFLPLRKLLKHIKTTILLHLSFLLILEQKLGLDILINDRDAALAAAEKLYKLQTALHIEADSFPTLAPSFIDHPLTDAMIKRAGRHFGFSTRQGLIRFIEEQGEIIHQVVAAAHERMIALE
jgi:predicted nucleotidyltransferase